MPVAELKTTYLGLELKNPLIAGASLLTSGMESLERMERAGAGAVVAASLFEEQIAIQSDRQEDLLMGYDNREQEEMGVFPGMAYRGPEDHLAWVRKAADRLSIPVIASLNAFSGKVWPVWGRRLEDSGAAALELNFYASPSDPGVSGQSMEDGQARVVEEVKSAVSIPVSVKLSSFYTNPLHAVKRLEDAGADGFVLFNRFLQPDLDPEEGKSVFRFDLSERWENRLPLRFIALLAGKIRGSLCASTGIHTASDGAKMILAGASAFQMVSGLYLGGIGSAADILSGLSSWMDGKGYASLGQFRGAMSEKSLGDPFAWKRAQYVRILMESGSSVGKYPLG